MNHILIPTDFSSTANNAVNYGLAFAQHYGLEAILFHCVGLAALGAYANHIALEEPTEELMHENQVKIDKLTQDFRANYPNLKISNLVKVGTFQDTLAESCEQNPPVAIVMGTSGSGTTIDKLIGSNAIMAMKELNTPVIVVPHGSSFTPISKIGFASDLKHVLNSTPIIGIKAFSALFRAELHVVHVTHHNGMNYEDTLNEAKALEEVLSQVSCQIHYVESDNVQEAIHNFVNANHIDLMIIVPKKYSFFESLFHKSQSTELAYTSTVPLMSLHLS